MLSLYSCSGHFSNPTLPPTLITCGRVGSGIKGVLAKNECLCPGTPKTDRLVNNPAPLPPDSGVLAEKVCILPGTPDTDRLVNGPTPLPPDSGVLAENE